MRADLVTHIPGGWAVQQFGGKAVLSANMLGTAVLCLLIPLTARATPALRAYALSAAFAMLGLCQGPLVPALMQMRRDWLPKGEGRPFALRLQALGHQIYMIINPLLPPFLALRFGWRSVPVAYAA
eukprot:COSAG04_NODE_17807_length_458_cov_1.119777_1_plen_125_part_10